MKKSEVILEFKLIKSIIISNNKWHKDIKSNKEIEWKINKEEEDYSINSMEEYEIFLQKNKKTK